MRHGRQRAGSRLPHRRRLGAGARRGHGGLADGLLEPFDPAILPPAPDGTPARDHFRAGAIMDCAVVQLVLSRVIAYDDRAFPGKKPRHLEQAIHQDPLRYRQTEALGWRRFRAWLGEEGPAR